MKIFYPPNAFPGKDATDGITIFLAGSIEMGTAVNWQDEVAEKLKNTNCVLLNPRREEWDSSWEQKIGNPIFYNQVTWELNGLEEADEILMYFDPTTKSPITLLELGLFARLGNLHVICPDGFWRKGNVDIVCTRYAITQHSSIDEYITDLIEYIK